jgi:hypothetical protein
LLECLCSAESSQAYCLVEGLGITRDGRPGLGVCTQTQQLPPEVNPPKHGLARQATGSSPEAGTAGPKKPTLAAGGWGQSPERPVKPKDPPHREGGAPCTRGEGMRQRGCLSAAQGPKWADRLQPESSPATEESKARKPIPYQGPARSDAEAGCCKEGKDEHRGGQETDRTDLRQGSLKT